MTVAFVASLEPKANSDSVELRATTVYFGDGVADVNPVSIIVIPGDTLAQIKQKMVEAILTQADSLGYSVTASNVILPVFQKGG